MAAKVLHWIVIALFVLTIGVNLVAWGGLATHPEFGAGIRASADREGPLANAYIIGGIGLSELGMREFNRDFADRHFAEVYQHLEGGTQAAMDVIENTRPLSMTLAHYGTPVLLLLAIVMSWLRPKPIRVMGGR